MSAGPKCPARCRRTNRSATSSSGTASRTAAWPAVPKTAPTPPRCYDNEGNFVDQLPTNLEEVPPRKTLNEGGWIGSARISGDYTHYAFSSIKAVFATGGLSESPGSVYDNDMETGRSRVISKTEGRRRHSARPDRRESPKTSSGSRRSPMTAHTSWCSAAPPHIAFTQFAVNYRLYMSIDEGGGRVPTFRRLQGQERS